MNKNIITAIVSVILGFLIGFSINSSDTKETMQPMQDHSSHMMNQDMSMKSMMHNMNASLEGKTGDEFDREFLVQMIVHHQGAVDMAEKVLEVSKRPELIELANAIIKAQESEIDMMQKWEQEWFN